MYVPTYVTEKEQTSIVDELGSTILMLTEYICIKNGISRGVLWEEKHRWLLKNTWSQTAW